ncbi:class I SAM-dependent methyltransferase [Nocardiopsis sp. NPDC007018]|uniref:class I SAM-dependent DNA methyltransferase n=1 Tax=Nocardiopsis sp. NPDC007018 TaxID=3155721 RepID=UPI00340338DF
MTDSSAVPAPPDASEPSAVWDAEMARSYDTPGEGVFAPEEVEPVVARLAALAGSGQALEFAAGTGRIAVPLAARGVPVTGVELSPAMVDLLRARADEDTVPVLVGDMATTRVPGDFTLVYLVYNTISNLLTQDEQVRCFANAAAHLGSGGRFVVELGVPELRRLPPGQDGLVFARDEGYVGLDTFDLEHQHLVSHHIRFGADREPSVIRVRQRYVWPAELDLMARMAGFALESRHADWHGTPFTGDSRSHVSVYRLPGRG